VELLYREEPLQIFNDLFVREDLAAAVQERVAHRTDKQDICKLW
jgi:hypothetical protein